MRPKNIDMIMAELEEIGESKLSDNDNIKNSVNNMIIGYDI